jgi:16S rRNA (cytosine1402-N4)-methyltransferase
LDRDAQALEIARERLKAYDGQVTLVHTEFSRIGEVVENLGLPLADGVLADLGVSSMQLDEAGRGFSFRASGPLDMRMDTSVEALTAHEIVNRSQERELADLLFQYGEERDSRRIARAIVRARPIRDTAHLATVVAGARKQGGRQKLHPATKTFLALRIAVNREMEELEQFLTRTPATLSLGGRWVVLAYHSLEDRLVKRVLAAGAESTAPRGLPIAPPGTEPILRQLTRGAQEPTEEEVQANPRAASAKFRAAERVRTGSVRARMAA